MKNEKNKKIKIKMQCPVFLEDINLILVKRYLEMTKFSIWIHPHGFDMNGVRNPLTHPELFHFSFSFVQLNHIKKLKLMKQCSNGILIPSPAPASRKSLTRWKWKWQPLTQLVQLPSSIKVPYRNSNYFSMSRYI